MTNHNARKSSTEFDSYQSVTIDFLSDDQSQRTSYEFQVKSRQAYIIPVMNAKLICVSFRPVYQVQHYPYRYCRTVVFSVAYLQDSTVDTPLQM